MSPPLSRAVQRGAISVSSASSPPPTQVVDTWISTVMKDRKYSEIVGLDAPKMRENTKDTITAISAAICAAGYTTSSAALRALIAADTTLADFTVRKNAYLDAIHRSRDLAAQVMQLKRTVLPALSARVLSTDKSNKVPHLESALESATLRRNNAVAECRAIHAFTQARYPGMESVDSLNKFKVYIQSPAYIADHFAIRRLECALDIQVIVFSARAYSAKDIGSIVSTAGYREINKTKSFVIISQSAANNVCAITYGGRSIIPYVDLPIELVQKCNSAYILRNTYFTPTITAVAGLYDPFCAIIIGENTDSTAYPCTGPGEFCKRETRLVDFARLATNKSGWRRWIADDWHRAPFRVNGKTYASVDHCCAAMSLAGEFPDIARCFVVESAHAWSTSPAKRAISEIKSSIQAMRVNMPSPATRRIARAAKFAQHPELASVLCNTYPALLISQTKPDIQLMQLREVLRTSLDKNNMV